MLVPMKDLMDAAERGGYALGMFNVMTAEMFRAVWEAAQETRSPVIIGTSEGMAKFLGVKYAVALVRAADEGSSLPVALHLDHTASADFVKACITAGYTSVMMDASDRPFHENVNASREIVDYAHDRGITVEAELGRLMKVGNRTAVVVMSAQSTSKS